MFMKLEVFMLACYRFRKKNISYLIFLYTIECVIFLYLEKKGVKMKKSLLVLYLLVITSINAGFLNGLGSIIYEGLNYGAQKEQMCASSLNAFNINYNIYIDNINNNAYASKYARNDDHKKLVKQGAELVKECNFIKMDSGETLRVYVSSLLGVNIDVSESSDTAALRVLTETADKVINKISDTSSNTGEKPNEYIENQGVDDSDIVEPTVDISEEQQVGLVTSYIAKIGYQDHYNSRGRRLTTLSDILRQDRANYHKFYKRDSEDEGDDLFSSKRNRGLLKGLVRNSNIPYSIENSVMHDTPIIEVRIYEDYLEIKLKG